MKRTQNESEKENIEPEPKRIVNRLENKASNIVQSRNLHVTENVKELVKECCSSEIKKIQIPPVKVEAKDILPLLNDEKVAEEILIQCIQVLPTQLFANSLQKIFSICFPAARITKEMKQKSSLVVEAMFKEYKDNLKSRKKREREESFENNDSQSNLDIENRKKSKNLNSGRKN